MKIAIGNDHAGTDYKLAIIGLLKSKGIEVVNYGTDGTDSVDYPDFTHPVAKDVEEGKVDFGIVICGSGNGATMTINKHQGIRGALCWNKEITQLAREHNDANILVLGGRLTKLTTAKKCVNKFFSTKFEGDRHTRRIQKIE